MKKFSRFTFHFLHIFMLKIDSKAKVNSKSQSVKAVGDLGAGGEYMNHTDHRIDCGRSLLLMCHLTDLSKPQNTLFLTRELLAERY